MCGRCACTRDPEAIQLACAYRRKDKSSVAKPAWLTVNAQKYFPSYNISPQTNTPVLIAGSHSHVQSFLKSDRSESLASNECSERVLQVMKWGLIPSWHKGNPRSFPTQLNNCRYDGMFEKPSFRNAITKKQRCVVLVDGFYEWQRKKGSPKNAFYGYFADNSSTEETKEFIKNEDMPCSSDISPRLLTLAGYFDIWKPDIPGEEHMFTYTMITVDATEAFGQIHHRMPAILDDEEAVRIWLDPKIPTTQAVKVINPHGSTNLLWHPVSSMVNNVRNKSPECIVKVDHTVKPESKGVTLLKWFKSSPKKKPSEETSNDATTHDSLSEEPPAKKPKIE